MPIKAENGSDPVTDYDALVSGCLCDKTRDDASRSFYETFTPLVRAIVSRILRDWVSEWDDACQTVFIHLFSQLPKWRREVPLDKWVAAVAGNKAIDILRQLKRDVVIRRPLPDDVSSPARADSALAECIERTVAAFKPEWRRVAELIEQGLTRERIAEELGRSRKAIQNWLVHIRERLLPCIRD